MNYKTGKCANCGANQGLHSYDTNQCPKNGTELSMNLWEKGERQQYQQTTFKDSGEKKLEDAAESMLDELKVNHDFLLALYSSLNNRSFNTETAQQLLRDRMAIQLHIIQKATS